jgi:hypothetical protein
VTNKHKTEPPAKAHPSSTKSQEDTITQKEEEDKVKELSEAHETIKRQE